MKKEDRLKEIEMLWKSSGRSQKWEDIQWETFIPNCSGIGLKPTNDLMMHLKYKGYIFWAMGLEEVETERFDWDSALLEWLHVWYSMPENWDTPIFINDSAYAICIPHFAPHNFAALFQNSDAVLLGMENWENSTYELEMRK